MNQEEFPPAGSLIQIKLEGEEEWLDAVVTRQKKMHVEVPDYWASGRCLVADESFIVDWRHRP